MEAGKIQDVMVRALMAYTMRWAVILFHGRQPWLEELRSDDFITDSSLLCDTFFICLKLNGIDETGQEMVFVKIFYLVRNGRFHWHQIYFCATYRALQTNLEGTDL